MGGGNSDMLGGLLRQLQQPGQMQIPQQPGRAQALGAPQMSSMGGQSPYGMTGMGQFGAMPSMYQPPAYQPAIFQPPQLAPAQDMAARFPTGGLLGGNFNGNGGQMGGPDDWRSPLTGGTGG